METYYWQIIQKEINDRNAVIDIGIDMDIDILRGREREGEEGIGRGRREKKRKELEDQGKEECYWERLGREI